MPYEEAARGLKFLIRVDELRADEALSIICPGCDARYLVATHHLHERYPHYSRLTLIGQEMVCRRCAHRGLGWTIVRAICEEEIWRDAIGKGPED